MHPDVQAYISNFVQACYPLLKKDEIKFISLTVLEQDDPVEKFVFEIKCLEAELTIEDIEQYLRACLIKLNQIAPSEDNKQKKSFKLSMEKKESGLPELTEQDWIPAVETTNPWQQILPLKSVPLFNTFVMESNKKKGSQ
ncbi:hypothetical protein BD770DRAFT_181154 [Pilaira anomala]|nr:hypothetical protein BD770DRAFT_181154 [Pilaira anomala]